MFPSFEEKWTIEYKKCLYTFITYHYMRNALNDVCDVNSDD